MSVFQELEPAGFHLGVEIAPGTGFELDYQLKLEVLPSALNALHPQLFCTTKEEPNYMATLSNVIYDSSSSVIKRLYYMNDNE